MLNLVQSIDNFMYAPVNNAEEVSKERERVLKLYDTTRSTDYLKFFNKLG